MLARLLNKMQELILEVVAISSSHSNHDNYESSHWNCKLLISPAAVEFMLLGNTKTEGKQKYFRREAAVVMGPASKAGK